MTTALYYHPVCQLHEMGENHPESPARMQVIMDALKENGLDRVLEYRLSPEATEEDIRRVHTQDMILKVKNDIPAPGDYSYVDETPLNQYSWQAALRTTGAAVAATDAVLDGEIENASYRSSFDYWGSDGLLCFQQYRNRCHESDQDSWIEKRRYRRY